MTKHQLLIVGVGSIGERHLRCFLNSNRVEISFCEVNEQLRADMAKRYRVEKTYAHFDDALADKHDVAVIATPAPFHVPQATALVQAATHVLIEKPLSISLDGVEELRQSVAARKVMVGVAYVMRNYRTLAAMRRAMQVDRFGKPVQIVAVGGQHFPTYRPAYQSIYYNDRKTGGGAIQDALTHVLNAGEWLVGPIDRVFADAAHQVLEGVTVEDTAHVLARHGNVLGSYSLNQHQAPNENSITVVCEHGTVRYEGHRNAWMWMIEPDSAWTEESFGPMERDTPFVLQAHAFLDAVEGKRLLPCTLNEGIQTLQVNLAALRSLETGTWQEISGEQNDQLNRTDRASAF